MNLKAIFMTLLVATFAVPAASALPEPALPGECIEDRNSDWKFCPSDVEGEVAAVVAAAETLVAQLVAAGLAAVGDAQAEVDYWVKEIKKFLEGQCMDDPFSDRELC